MYIKELHALILIFDTFSNLSDVYQEETEYFRFVIVYLNGFLNLLIYDIMCK